MEMRVEERVQWVEHALLDSIGFSGLSSFVQAMCLLVVIVSTVFSVYVSLFSSTLWTPTRWLMQALDLTARELRVKQKEQEMKDMQAALAAAKFTIQQLQQNIQSNHSTATPHDFSVSQDISRLKRMERRKSVANLGSSSQSQMRGSGMSMLESGVSLHTSPPSHLLHSSSQCPPTISVNCSSSGLLPGVFVHPSQRLPSPPSKPFSTESLETDLASHSGEIQPLGLGMIQRYSESFPPRTLRRSSSEILISSAEITALSKFALSMQTPGETKQKSLDGNPLQRTKSSEHINRGSKVGKDKTMTRTRRSSMAGSCELLRAGTLPISEHTHHSGKVGKTRPSTGVSSGSLFYQEIVSRSQKENTLARSCPSTPIDMTKHDKKKSPKSVAPILRKPSV